MRIKTVLISSLLIAAIFLQQTSQTNAHVAVKPEMVGIGAFQTFTIGVPNEKDIPTISLKIVLPEGLAHVTPNVKQGWNIEVVKSGEGENTRVSEIIWTGGNIPAEQRDEFLFSAQVPSSETSLSWKAYQTYQDGTIVAWDQDAKHESNHEEENSGPSSTTQIINDLEETKEPVKKTNQSFLPLIALALSAVALGIALRNRK